MPGFAQGTVEALPLPVDAAEFLLPGKHLELFPPEFEQGPCLDSFNTGKPVVAADLRKATARWPHFTARANAEGFRAAHAVPLRRGDETLGSVTLLSVKPGKRPV